MTFEVNHKYLKTSIASQILNKRDTENALKNMNSFFWCNSSEELSIFTRNLTFLGQNQYFNGYTQCKRQNLMKYRSLSFTYISNFI